MDTILVAVTGISLALAGGMGILLARMLREERRRSDARVQLLELLAAKQAVAPAAQPRARVLDEIELRPAVTTGVHDLFHEEHESSPWPRRFAVIAGMAVVFSVVIFGWGQLRVSDAPSATPTSSESAVAQNSPLELLSLRHAREGGILTVTGLVQNPLTGAALSRVQATLLVFGPGGTLLTSAKAPLDFTSLTPGDESPFVIRVPVTGDVARYRVGFRAADDRVLAHVDRRNDQVGRAF